MKHYTIEEKQALVKDIDDLIKSGKSRKQACKQMHTDDRTYESAKKLFSDPSSISVQSDIESHTNRNLPFNELTVRRTFIPSSKKRKIRFMVSLSEEKLNRLKFVAHHKETPYATLAAQYIAVMLDKESF
jgi:hypothetical protein